MRHTMFGFAIILVIMLSSTAAVARDKEIDWYDDVGIFLAHDVDHHFYEARLAFLEKRADASADEIRQGAAFLVLEADRSSGEEERALVASVRELKGLADDVEKGNVTSSERLDKAFARAHYALAKSHYAYAKKAWEDKDVKTAAKALRVAAIHLERAMVWPGYKKKEYVAKVVKDIDLVAGKLLGGSDWVAEEVEKAIEALGKAIDELGKELEPAKQ